MLLDRFTGERGELAAWRDSSLFTGNNVMIQVDGALTSRPNLTRPWVEFEWESGFAGLQLYGAGLGAGTDTGIFPRFEHVWFVMGQQLWGWEGFDGVSPELIGSLDSIPSAAVTAVRQGSTVWIASPDEGLYKYAISSTGFTLTKISNVVPGPAFAVWQGLEICAGSDAVGSPTPGRHRIYWSDSPGSWPSSTNYNDIGDEGSAVTGLFVLRNQLLVAKDDGSWWMVTGELATTDNPEAAYSVRDVSRTNYPIVRQSSGFVNEQIVAFSPDVAGFPVTYNGSQFTEIRYLYDNDLRGAQVIGGAGIGDLLFHKNGKALLYQNGAWVRLTVPANSIAVLYPRQDGTQVFAFIEPPVDEGEIPPRCSLLLADPLTDPAVPTLLDSAYTDSSVTLAELINDQGLVQISDIYIYYRRIATTDSISGFDVRVVPRRFANVDGTTVPAQPDVIDFSATDTYEAGSYIAVINCKHIPAYAFEVTISNIQGCCIERIYTEPVRSGVTKK